MKPTLFSLLIASSLAPTVFAAPFKPKDSYDYDFADLTDCTDYTDYDNYHHYTESPAYTDYDDYDDYDDDCTDYYDYQTQAYSEDNVSSTLSSSVESTTYITIAVNSTVFVEKPSDLSTQGIVVSSIVPSSSTSESLVTSSDQSSSNSPTSESFITSSVPSSSSSSGDTITTTSQTSASESTSSSSGTYTGRGTYYTPGADNCGTSSTESDLIVAIAHSLYETTVDGQDISSYCGQSITANYNGNSVVVKVVDSCESCTDNDLDFSPAAFQKLADLDVGEIEITWSWN